MTKNASPEPHKAWHSRGYIPHCDTPNLIQSITFRLYDSLPDKAIARMKDEVDSSERRERVEQMLDAGHGECWLKNPEIAKLVEDALLHFDGQRYRLLAWCIMPNHVHVLVETKESFPLGQVVGGWKSFTAKQVNRIFARDGQVWMPDYYDRFIRDDGHLEAVICYIEENPIKAGLVERAEDWEFSSARTRTFPGTGGFPGSRAGRPRSQEELR